MWCSKCQREIIDCICPDINERLASLAKIPAISVAVQQNMLAREMKKKSSLASVKN